MRRAALPWLRYALLIAGAYLVFLAAMVPAPLLYDLWQRQFPEAARDAVLEDVRGTLWQGSAGQARVSGVQLGRLAWDLHVLPLFLGRLSMDWQVRHPQAHAHGTLVRTLSGAVQVDRAEGRIEGEALASVLRAFPLRLGGELRFNLTALRYLAGQRLQAEGRAVWHGAGLSAPQALQLGDFLATLAPQGEGTRIALADQGGPLRAEGVVELGADGQAKVQLQLAPRDSASQALRSALSMLGRPDRDGAYTLRWNGRIQ